MTSTVKTGSRTSRSLSLPRANIYTIYFFSESRAGFGFKPIIPLLPVPIPTVLPTATLPKPYGFTTPMPYLNPIPFQNYQNAPTYFKGIPVGSFNLKPQPAKPVYPKPDYPQPSLSLIDDFTKDIHGNAYPLLSSSAPPLDIFPQDIFPKDLYSKLFQASEHPVSPYHTGVYNPFGNTGYQNPNIFLGQKDFNLLPYTFKRSM